MKWRTGSGGRGCGIVGGSSRKPLDAFAERVKRGASELGEDAPTDLTIEGWWDQARTLEDE